MPRYTSLQQIPRFTREPNYQCDVSWDYLQDWIARNSPDLDPDFQRGHVWTRPQQIAFVEFCLRGGTSGRNLYLNSPNYLGSRDRLVMVDGKQRLTAVVSWLQGDFPVFGETWRRDLPKVPFADHNTSFRVHVNNLQSRQEVLEWYLEMNTGGTPHAEQELNRVRGLLIAEASGLWKSEPNKEQDHD